MMMQLCNLFKSISMGTWHHNKVAHSVNYQFGEETITDVILFLLKASAPNLIKIRKFNRREEGIYGADWLWVFLSNGTALPMFIQAKRLETSTRKYEHLDYWIGKAKTSRQCDVLVDIAKKNGIYPAYVFYNYVTDTHIAELSMPCASKQTPWCPHHQKELYGCTIADAVAIKQGLHKTVIDPSIKNISRLSVPWHCFVCCQPRGPNQSLTQQALSMAVRLAGRRDGSDQHNGIPKILDSIPDYVNLALRDDEQEYDERLHNIIFDTIGNINGLVIVGESETDLLCK